MGLTVKKNQGRIFIEAELKQPYVFNCSSCKRELTYEKRFNHDGVRVIEAFPCPFCLEDEAGYPNPEDMETSLHAREVLVLKLRDTQRFWEED